MGAVIYSRSARRNRATQAHQRAACQRVAAELGYVLATAACEAEHSEGDFTL